jgi:molybdopterin-guanine dinucleotide biosynthesis protein B
VAVSGPSGAGKTRLIRRLLPALAARGLRVAYLKHTGHAHPLDRRGKDTEVVLRAGAVAAAIQGPHAMALFGPPAPDIARLAALLPPCDLVLAEGWSDERLARVEVHRRGVSRHFLCLGDRRVFAVVSDEPPPRAVPWLDPDQVEGLADLLAARLDRPGRAARRGRRTRRASAP